MQDCVVIEIRSVVETVMLLQHWSEQEEQQQQNCTDFGKPTRHAQPSIDFIIHIGAADCKIGFCFDTIGIELDSASDSPASSINSLSPSAQKLYLLKQV